MFPAIPEDIPSPRDPPQGPTKQAGPFVTSVADHPGRAYIGSEEVFKISCLELDEVVLLWGKVWEGKWSAGKKHCLRMEMGTSEKPIAPAPIPATTLDFPPAGLDMPPAECVPVAAEMFTTEICVQAGS